MSERLGRTLVACASSSSLCRWPPTCLALRLGQSSASKGASRERICSEAAEGLALADAGSAERPERPSGVADEGCSFLRWAGISKAIGCARVAEKRAGRRVALANLALNPL